MEKRGCCDVCIWFSGLCDQVWCGRIHIMWAVLNPWSMILFLPICERLTAPTKHYFPKRKKMFKLPASSYKRNTGKNFSMNHIGNHRTCFIVSKVNCASFLSLSNFILRKVWKWNIWQILCNLGANVTNDAIKVGAPSYKLLLNPPRKHFTTSLIYTIITNLNKKRVLHFTFHFFCDSFVFRFQLLMGSYEIEKISWCALERDYKDKPLPPKAFSSY